MRKRNVALVAMAAGIIATATWVAPAIGEALGVAVTAVGAIAAVLPAFGSQEVVRLHFAPDGSSIAFTYNGTSQALIPTTRCEISSTSAAGPLMTLTSNRKLGINSNGIGVKTGGSQGTPCGRVDTTENITLSIPASGVLAGRTMNKMTLDLELKGNAWVEVKLSRGGSQVGPVFGLQTGSSIQAGLTPLPGPPYMATSTSSQPTAACASPSDSGPDSGANDNCLWTIDPGVSGGPSVEFDTATFTVRVGEFSLEGSGDYGGNTAYDSLFYLSNQAPLATADAYSTNEDTVLNANVLSNDIDGDGDPLTVTAVNGAPANVGSTISLGGNGSVTVGSTGALTYTPAFNFNGPAGSLTYTVSDGQGGTSTATVSISVTAVNDPPVAVSSSPTTPEDTPTTITVGTDVDSTALTATCDVSESGSVVDNGNGSVTYSPAPDFFGTETITCTVSDGQATATASAVVTVGVTGVNDPPIAGDDVADTDEGTAVVITVLDNDTDVDGDTLTVVAVTAPSGGNAAITDEGMTITYTPGALHLGPDSFVYTVSDGNSGTDTATVSVETFATICSADTVTDSDGSVTGTFTRIGDELSCKRYTLEADGEAGTVLFQPVGADEDVPYRGYLTLGSTNPPASGDPVNLFLEYDPAGGDTFQPVPWCDSPTFDASGDVLTATVPGYPTGADTWCIASAYTRGIGNQLVTTWQVFGFDDPKFQ